MIRTRRVLAMGLALVVGVTGIALADGTSDNVSTVKSKVTPSKLPKREYKKAKLNAGVATDRTSGDGAIPLPAVEEVYMDFDDDIKIGFRGISKCAVGNASLQGTTTAQAIAACGVGSRMSVPGTATNPQKGGKASARLPSPGGPVNVTDLIVTTFRAQQRNHIILHAYSPSLGAGLTQVVDGAIVASPRGGDFGKRLSVPDAPDLAGDAAALTSFEATLVKGIKARCHDRNKKFNTKANFVYDDGTEDNASSAQSCRIRR